MPKATSILDSGIIKQRVFHFKCSSQFHYNKIHNLKVKRERNWCSTHDWNRTVDNHLEKWISLDMCNCRLAENARLIASLNVIVFASISQALQNEDTLAWIILLSHLDPLLHIASLPFHSFVWHTSKRNFPSAWLYHW